MFICQSIHPVIHEYIFKFKNVELWRGMIIKNQLKCDCPETNTWLISCAVSEFMSVQSTFILRSRHRHTLSWACYEWNCVPPDSYVEVSTPTPGTTEYDLIWKWGLYRMSQVTMRSWGWSLIQLDWCYCKKRKCGHGDTWREESHLQAKEGDLEQMLPTLPSEGTNFLLNLGLEILASRSVRRYTSARSHIVCAASFSSPSRLQQQSCDLCLPLIFIGV